MSSPPRAATASRAAGTSTPAQGPAGTAAPPHAFVCSLGVMLVVLAVYAAADVRGRGLLYNAVGVLTAVAVAARLRRHRGHAGHDSRGWALLLGGQAAIAVADLMYFRHEALFGVPIAWGTGYAEPVYFAAFILMIAGVGSLARGRGAERPHAIEAAMLATTVGLATWVFLMEPMIGEAGVYGLAQAVGIGYGAVSVVVIGVAGMLLLAPGRPEPSTVGLAAGYAGLALSVIVYGRQTLDGSYVAGGILDLSYILSYTLVGLAALGPCPAERTPRRVGPVPHRTRLFAVGAAALVGPLLVAGDDHLNVVELAVACFVLYSLALGRTAVALSTLERYAAGEAAQRAQLDAVVERLGQAEAERRRLLDEVLFAAEAARTALALELHDGPIQHLATAALRLDIARMALDGGDAATARRSLLTARWAIGREIGALRGVMAELRPPALDESGLSAAVLDRAHSFSDRFGVACTVTVDVVGRLDAGTETLLYRVVDEALSNVQRHADAKAVEITILETGTSISLTVADDGAGFEGVPPSALRPPDQIGLAALHERAALAGGALTVTTAPGAGTVVHLSIDRPRRKSSDEPLADRAAG